MRIYDNGIYRDMTEEDIANNMDVPEAKKEITPEERIEALEAAMLDLMGVILNG